MIIYLTLITEQCGQGKSDRKKFRKGLQSVMKKQGKERRKIVLGLLFPSFLIGIGCYIGLCSLHLKIIPSRTSTILGGDWIINKAIEQKSSNNDAIPFVCPDNNMLDITFFIRLGSRIRYFGTALVFLCFLAGFFIGRRLTIPLIFMNFSFICALIGGVYLAAYHGVYKYRDTHIMMSR